jgi:hypothetical protein
MHRMGYPTRVGKSNPLLDWSGEEAFQTPRVWGRERFGLSC